MGQEIIALGIVGVTLGLVIARGVRRMRSGGAPACANCGNAAKGSGGGGGRDRAKGGGGGAGGTAGGRPHGRALIPPSSLRAPRSTSGRSRAR